VREEQPVPAAADHRRARARAATSLLVGFLALVLIGWGAGALWVSIVGSAELDAVRELAAQRTAGLTAVMRAVTWAGSAFLLVPLALICCVALAFGGRRREALLLVLCLGGAMLLSDLIKLLVSRPRPPVEHLQTVRGSSFPSGHATQASAFWFSLVVVLRAAGGSKVATGLAAAAASTLVLAVAASRVYLGVHYPADVIAGVLLGGGWTAWVWHSLERGAL
jgi:undecaprenyl-diphosphatase